MLIWNGLFLHATTLILHGSMHAPTRMCRQVVAAQEAVATDEQAAQQVAADKQLQHRNSAQQHRRQSGTHLMYSLAIFCTPLGQVAVNIIVWWSSGSCAMMVLI